LRENARERRDNLDGYDDDYYDGYYGSDWDSGWQDSSGTAGAAAGGGGSAGYVEELPCSGASVAVNDDVYYDCGTWYRRAFRGGTVVYIVSGPPPGY
jgi:hypothetical protein